jgi:hypothetical protein
VHRFCLAAIIGPWIAFELVQTKLVHYLLPVFPPLAFLTADMLVSVSRRRHGELCSQGFLIAVRVWFGIVIVLGLVGWYSAFVFDLEPAAFVGLALISVFAFEYGRSVWRFFKASRALDAAVAMGIGMLLFVAILYGLYLPHAPFLRVSQRVALVLEHESADPDSVIMIDYKEDSLAFYQGGTIRRESDNLFLLHRDRTDWPRWLVITDRVWQLMPSAIRDQFDEVGRARGLWYVKGGKIVTVLVLRKRTLFALPARPAARSVPEVVVAPAVVAPQDLVHDPGSACSSSTRAGTGSHPTKMIHHQLDQGLLHMRRVGNRQLLDSGGRFDAQVVAEG